MTKRLRSGECRRAHLFLHESPPDFLLPAGAIWSQIAAVQEVCPAGDCYLPLPLAGPTLFLTLQGSAELTVGGQPFTHRAGSLLAVASGCAVREQVGAGQDWHVCYLQVRGAWAEQLDAWLHRQEPPVVAGYEIPARRRQVFLDMIEVALAQREGWQWRFTGWSAELLGDLYSDTSLATSGDALILQIARLIDAMPSERKSVAEMARLLNLTPRQLIYRFSLAAGEPLAHWIRRRRIASARVLLGQGQSVSQVAEQLGFANPYHFSRTFKAVTQTTPSAFRAAALQSAAHFPALHSETG